ncbi:MAG: hypothetical protein H8D43_04075, partial [Chloroflexi bacterium]|nr:hypothetical protein [Chloroflexota bacterium]
GTGKIQRANLDGTGVEDLIKGLNTGKGPRGIAIRYVRKMFLPLIAKAAP